MNFFEARICKARLKCSWFRQNMDENLSHRFHRLKKKSSTNYFVIKKTACREAYHSALTNSRVLILQMFRSYRLETALKTLKIAENQGFSLL